MTTLRQNIRNYIIHDFLFDDEQSMLSDDASLLQNGVIDSTGVLDLLLFVEDTFDVRVPDEDLTPENFDSVDNLAHYIEARIAVSV
jgi:acyl carrier protein